MPTGSPVSSAKRASSPRSAIRISPGFTASRVDQGVLARVLELIEGQTTPAEQLSRLKPRFTAGRPMALFRHAGVYRMSGAAIAYDVNPDGQRFIMVSEAEGSGDAGMRQHVNVILNWLDELQQRVAPLDDP